MTATPEDYLAKAAEALAQLETATSETERQRLRRAHGVYLKLSTHGAEAAERAAMAPAARIRPEKPTDAATPKLQGWSIR
ncbi:MAG TPA: hypothetical protein VJS15_05500 [Allosphingosinicella sp.]|nr:hypothetical protein [Allosphingosinicella sp.]